MKSFTYTNLYISCMLLFYLGLMQLPNPISSSALSNSPDSRFESAEAWVNHILNDSSKYDPKIRPKGENGTGPTLVSVNIYLRSIYMIDDIKMEYRIQTTIRQIWRDPRLDFSKMYDENVTIPEDSSKFWTPDLFFLNEKHATLHEMMKPNIMIRITPKGSILLSTRISLSLSCPMSLKYYPLDRQTCSIKMGSYSWLTKDLIFSWKLVEPIQVPTPLHLARFTLTGKRTSTCDHKTNTGTYSCILAEFDFKRELGYYMIQNFIPCGMIVMVSWISFWLGSSTIDARVSLGITTMLTMVAQIYGINQSVPPVSYAKALDIWTGSCLLFIVLAIIEVSIVGYNIQLYKYKKSLTLPFTDMGMGLPNNQKPVFGTVALKRSQKIDFISRILFPTLFLMFNIVYWYTYQFAERDGPG